MESEDSTTAARGVPTVARAEATLEASSLSPQVRALQLNLPGLLRLLGGHLYSDPLVAYRELVQNAHDSCTRRRVALEHSGRQDTYEPAIRIRCFEDGGREFVTVADNGDGMTADEVERFLATIGRGGTSELRDILRQAGAAAALDLIGQFGVGLLAAFLVADRVEVFSRKHDAPEGAGVRWVCEGQQTYRLERCRLTAGGTVVRLRVRSDASELGRPSVVKEAVHRYARYLGVPIRVGAEPRAVNARVLPWYATACQKEREHIRLEELGAEWCRGLAPLATLPLEPFDDPTLGHVPLRGVLCVAPVPLAGVVEFGEVGVLIRRMVVTLAERDLLPPWAGFVTGLVDCPVLSPTASREQLRRDDAFAAVARAIECQLLDWLRRLQREQPVSWELLLLAHGRSLRECALQSESLFEILGDALPFRTTRGEMTLPAYLEASGGSLYYFSDEQEARTMALLLESARRPVIDAQCIGEEGFLRRYAERRGVRLVRELGGDGAGAIQAVDTPDPALERLREAMNSADLPAALSRFEPTCVPALVVVPRRALVQRRTAAAVHTNPRLRRLGTLLSDYLEAPAARSPLLHVNVDCPLVQRLARLDRSDPRLEPALLILRELARTLSGERLTPLELARSVQAGGAALARLVGIEESEDDDGSTS